MMRSFIALALVVPLLAADAGTFAKFNTLLPVPASATGTTNGDTSTATTNTIHLDASVYVPDGVAAPAPVVFVIHGFGGSKSDARVVTLATDFAAAGYVVVTPTVRGFGDSDGLVSLVGPNEINDLKTLILAVQTGTIGDSPAVTVPVTGASKIGLLGPSYGGGHTFETLRTHVPGLTAAVAIIGWTDLYQALCPNDVPKLTYSLGLFAGGFDPTNPNYADQMYDWQRALLGGKPEQIRTGNAQNNIDWRSVIFNPSELSVPTFIVQGWRDYLFPADQAFTLWQTPNAIPFQKLYIGGLGHPPASLDITGAEGVYLRGQALRWFDQWLKGVDTGILREPRITFAPEKTQDWSSNALIQADSLPLAGTTTNTLFFSGAHLASAPSDAAARSLSASTSGLFFLKPLLAALGLDNKSLIDSIISLNALLNSGATGILDPKMFTKADGSAKTLRFTGDPLPAGLLVIGSPVFHLTVSAAQKNAYYFVQIQERLPNGSLKLVSRGAYKDHAVEPSVPHAIEISPFAINHRFLAGSRILATVTSRDYPFFLPNLTQPKVKIYRDTTRSTSLSLPVVP